jgi:hypothetical protein
VVSDNQRFLTLMFEKSGDNCLYDIKVLSGRNEIAVEALDLCNTEAKVLRNP